MTDETTTETTAGDAESAVASMASEAIGATESGRPENVPEKFWDTETSAVKTDDVLKSYTELEKRFGSFTGSPDEYAFNTSDEMNLKLQDMGIELSVDDDPLYKAALEMAQETGMNQEGFDRLANLYVMTQLGNAQADAEYKQQQLAELGDRAEVRVNNLNAWGEKNLSPELLGSLQESLTSARMVPVLEHLIASTRNAPVSDVSATPAPSASEGELKAMQFAKDDNGNRRIHTDPSFKADYDRKMKEFYGEGENRIMVG